MPTTLVDNPSRIKDEEPSQGGDDILATKFYFFSPDLLATAKADLLATAFSGQTYWRQLFLHNRSVIIQTHLYSKFVRIVGSKLTINN